MEKYYLNTEIEYLNPYIPPRCRKTRYEEKTEQIRVGIRSISSEEAPIAFRLSDYNHVSDHKTEIRYYKGKFYEQMKRFDTRCCYGDERFELVTVNELSIVPYYRCNRSRNDCVNNCKEFAKKHLIIDGFAWRQCGEPMYCVITFGLGHNHGSTGLFVEHFYNHNISNDNYFSALDGKRAVEYANTVAALKKVMPNSYEFDDGYAPDEFEEEIRKGETTDIYAMYAADLDETHCVLATIRPVL